MRITVSDPVLLRSLVSVPDLRPERARINAQRYRNRGRIRRLAERLGTTTGDGIAAALLDGLPPRRCCSREPVRLTATGNPRAPSAVASILRAVVFLVSLLYPNGRTHEAVLDHAETPKLGTMFEMYGRTWRVNEIHDGSTAAVGRVA